jgi:hypothetical protein
MPANAALECSMSVNVKGEWNNIIILILLLIKVLNMFMLIAELECSMSVNIKGDLHDLIDLILMFNKN